MNFHRKPHTFVGQVNLKVQHLARSLAFYREVIGFRVLKQTERTADLTADGKTALLSIEVPDRVVKKQEGTTGLYHFALLLPVRSDLARIIRHFADIGQRFGSSDHLVSEALYLSDPDGNGIEIYRDRAFTDWKWNGGEVEMSVDPLNFEDLLSGTEQRQAGYELPAGTVMGHIHLHVSELRETEQFYTKGLGFEVVNRFGTQALFLSTGKYHHHIGLNTWNGLGAREPAENSVGLRSFALIYPDESTRDQAVARLRDGHATVMEDEDGTTVAVDPSGNRMRLLV